MVRTLRSTGYRLILAAMLLALTGGWSDTAVSAEDDELTKLLRDVGEEYAKAYLSPLVSGLGANQLSNLFSSAAISATDLKFSFGLKFIATRIAEEDQAFRKVVRVTLDETYGLNPGDTGYGEMGLVDITGPTVLGDDEEMGSIQPYYQGVPVGGPVEGIEALGNMRNVPLAVPEVSVEGVAGLRATLRFLPTISIGDIGDLNVLGFGLQYSINQHFPQFPVDLMAGFFVQKVNVGESLETSATSFFMGASRNYAPATLYTGLALESSTVDVSYDFVDEFGAKSPISFEMDGDQDFRFTIGATLDFGVRLNVEAGMGTMSTYSAGLMVGL